MNALYDVQSWLPYTIFGCFGLLQIMTTFFLPETLGLPMLTTVDQAEEFYGKNQMKKSSSQKSENQTVL